LLDELKKAINAEKRKAKKENGKAEGKKQKGTKS
jgi:hypothetical protein